MTDDLDLLRSFRSDLGQTDHDTITRIRAAVADRIATHAEHLPTSDLRAHAMATGTDAPIETDLPYVASDDADERRQAIGAARHRRRAFMGAAAVLFLLVAAVAVFASQDAPETGIADLAPDQTTSEASTTEPAPPSSIPALGPTRVPEGFALSGAVRPEASQADAAGGESWTIYTPGGQGGRDGQTAPRGIAVSALGSVPEDARLATLDPDGATPVEVGAGSAIMETSGDAVLVLLELDGGEQFRLVGRGVDSDAVVAAAASVSVDGDGAGHIAPDALPDGWAQFATRPQVAVGASLAYMVADPTRADGASVNPTIVVSWSLGTAEDLEAARLFMDETAVGCGDAPCPTVGGAPTVVGRSIFSELAPDGQLLTLSWVREGIVVTIDGTGVPLGELYTMAESLEETTWEALESQLPAPVDGPTGRP